MTTRTRILIGPSYHFSLRSYTESMMIEPIVGAPVPPQLAWTKMNTSWKKGKRK